MFPMDVSGIKTLIATAAPRDPTAVAERTEGGVFKAFSASGISLGNNSIPFATNGRILSLDDSSNPKRSLSSASFNRGIADEGLKPAFSNFVSNPKRAVY